MKKVKKGFTLTELIIVIVIIGILAAVLIPSLSSYIKKAKISADVALVKNLNSFLATIEIEDGKNKTMSGALSDAFEAGYTIEKITPTSSGDILWDEVNDRFLLVDDNEFVYGEDASKEVFKDKKYKLWKIVSEINENTTTYSYYLSGTEVIGDITASTGIDVGRNTNITSITYNNNEKKTVIINTNGGILNINAPNDTIHHYGYLQELKVENVSTSECYYEHGYIETLTSFTTGKIIMTKDAVFHDKQEEILQVLNQNEKVINVGEQYEVHHYGRDGVCTKPGCNAYNDAIHVHKWNEGEITTNPTCEYDGEKIYTCIECNSVKVEVLPKLNHNYVNGVCINCNQKQPYKIVGNYVYFGEYPQTLKADSVSILSTAPNSDGYYLGSDGERYAKILAKPCSSTEIEKIYFNNQKQIVEGTTYYFKVEPIKWKILQVNGTQYTLMTDLLIDRQQFHSSRDTRIIDGKTIYSNNYEYSDIRKWLNNEFYNKAFSEDLHSYINTTIVDNSIDTTCFSSEEFICNDTYDKVYLLSYKDITNTEYGFTDNTSRQKQVTDYAKAMGCFANIDNSSNREYGSYWLRSSYGVGVWGIVTTGYFTNGYADSYPIGVSPIISVNIINYL